MAVFFLCKNSYRKFRIMNFLLALIEIAIISLFLLLSMRESLSLSWDTMLYPVYVIEGILVSAWFIHLCLSALYPFRVFQNACGTTTRKNFGLTGRCKDNFLMNGISLLYHVFFVLPIILPIIFGVDVASGENKICNTYTQAFIPVYVILAFATCPLLVSDIWSIGNRKWF
jgi:hypothetical protein